jgi:hypothetical protein
MIKDFQPGFMFSSVAAKMGIACAWRSWQPSLYSGFKFQKITGAGDLRIKKC